MFEPCSPTDPPEGTGDDWSERLVWTGTVPDPAQDVTVRVRARISYGTDPANDFLYLEAWGDPYWTTLQGWTGTGTAVAVDASITLTPDRYAGPGGDQVQLRWLFSSDGAFSDEDCLWPGTGAQVDSIAVTFDQGAGEILQGTVETCEPGDPQRWVPIPDQGVGEFSAVRAGLGDLDPDRDNTSPQFTFIDDGVVEPGTDGQPCVTWCYGPGGWIVNQDRGLADHFAYLHNEVWSPPLPLPAEPWDGALLAFDIYLHLVTDGSMRVVAAVWHVRSTADPAGLTGWSPWRDRGTAYGGGPGYARVHQEVSDLLEPGAAWVQIALGARDLGWSTGIDGTPAPYFDNVALKVYPRAAPAVITVGPDGGGDYATIQGALNAAAAGDTIKLADGIFAGAGNRDLDWLGKDVVVCSASGNRAQCIIDCGGSPETPHRAARFDTGEGPGAVLMGVTVRNGWQGVAGGAVLVVAASPSFVDCLFTNNMVVCGPPRRRRRGCARRRTQLRALRLHGQRGLLRGCRYRLRRGPTGVRGLRVHGELRQPRRLGYPRQGRGHRGGRARLHVRRQHRPHLLGPSRALRRSGCRPGAHHHRLQSQRAGHLPGQRRHHHRDPGLLRPLRQPGRRLDRAPWRCSWARTATSAPIPASVPAGATAIPSR